MAKNNITKAITITINGKEVEDSLKGIGREMGQLKKQLREATTPEDRAKITADLNQIKQRYQDINDELREQKVTLTDIRSAGENIFNGLLSGDFESVADGFNTIKTGIGGATKAGLAFIATPIGAAIAVLAGIGLAAKAWFDYNQEVSKTNQLIREVTGENGAAVDEIRIRAEVLRDNFELDIKESTETAKSLVKNMGISYTEAFDIIEKGALKGKLTNGEYLDSLKEYPVQFKNAGYTATEFANIVEAGIDLSIYSDKLPDALKEADLALKEGTKATADALINAFGAPFADSILSRVSSGKITTKQALQEIAQESKKTGLTHQQTQQLTADLFKGAGEDAGGAVKIFEALRLAQEKTKKPLTEIEKLNKKNLDTQKELNKAISDVFGMGSSWDKFMVYTKTSWNKFLLEMVNGIKWIGSWFSDPEENIKPKKKPTQNKPTNNKKDDKTKGNNNNKKDDKTKGNNNNKKDDKTKGNNNNKKSSSKTPKSTKTALTEDDQAVADSKKKLQEFLDKHSQEQELVGKNELDQELLRIKNKYSEQLANAEKYHLDTKALKEAQTAEEDLAREKNKQKLQEIANNEEAKKKEWQLQQAIENATTEDAKAIAILEKAQFVANRELSIEQEKEIARLQLIGASEEQISAVKERYNNIKADNEKKHTNTLTKINADANKAKLKDINTMFGNLAVIMGKQSKAGKAAAIAQTTIDTYQSATASYAAYAKINPILGVIAAAAAIKMGFDNVKNIIGVKEPAQPGYFYGGYTGSKGIYQDTQGTVAGVVHTNEWVAPAWMTNNPKFASTLQWLEAERQKGIAGYSMGGVVTPANQNTNGPDTTDKGIVITANDNNQNITDVLTKLSKQLDTLTAKVYFGYDDLESLEKLQKDVSNSKNNGKLA